MCADFGQILHAKCRAAGMAAAAAEHYAKPIISTHPFFLASYAAAAAEAGYSVSGLGPLCQQHLRQNVTQQ